jgi:ribonucleoside-diphosphate reductase alpha chain
VGVYAPGALAQRREAAAGVFGVEAPMHEDPPGPAPGGGSADEPVPESHAAMVSVRRSLPSTRESITHKFSINRHEGYLTIGLYSDGQPGEIFIKMAKEGSTISGMCQAFCRAFSLAIQHGLSIEDAVSRFRGMRFEPMGPTTNPDIPDTTSIVDYVARYLEVHFGAPTRR